MNLLIATAVTLLIGIRAYRRKSLTPAGLLAAAITAAIHAAHPSPIPFTLLVVFFILGTGATKVKHDIKATLTISSTGSAGGEGARTSTQVFANSGVASGLIIAHLWSHGYQGGVGKCFGGEDVRRDLIMLGIIANYAAVTADTLSSELGILSKTKPRLITAPWKIVPPGTNGGVTMAGLLSGTAGSFVIGVVSVLLMTFCSWESHFFPQAIEYQKPAEWGYQSRAALVLGVTALGVIGTVLDSLLGALLQASVVDKRTGKIVEGAGGVKVLTTSSSVTAKKDKDEESRKVDSGRDILDNNQINSLMALLTSLIGIAGGILLENTSQFLSRGGGMRTRI